MASIISSACMRLAIAGVLAAVSAPPLLAAQASSYRLQKAVTIASSDTGWDYNSLDQQRGRMFIAHRKDGLHVYDVKAGKLLKTLANSQGANTSALAPEFDRGIAGTTEGDVVVFSLANMATLSRYKSATGGFDGATFDGVTKRFAMVGEADEEKKITPLLIFDARTGKPIGSLLIDSVKVDAPRPDGKGSIFLPLRDKSQVVRVDMNSIKLQSTFALADCVHPASLEVDQLHQRIFVGCRGQGNSKPALAVLDVASGRQILTLPIGRGVDEVMYDARNRTVVTANGEDGSMSIIEQQSADRYRLAETVGTRPMARTGVLDEGTGKIYLVNAEYAIRHADGEPATTRFVPNTFTVLTFAR
jgi:hypothetical protein